MSNPDLLNQADKVLRPVLQKLAHISWLRVTGCCAGHQPEDNVWFELQVRGNSGLWRTIELLRVLDGKLAGTECRTDCLVAYGREEGEEEDGAPDVPHGWFPLSVEIFWGSNDDWRRGQALIVESVLSSVEEMGETLESESTPEGAMVYCPFCSSSFVRLDAIEATGNRYACGDCESGWTMIDPRL